MDLSNRISTDSNADYSADLVQKSRETVQFMTENTTYGDNQVVFAMCMGMEEDDPAQQYGVLILYQMLRNELFLETFLQNHIDSPNFYRVPRFVKILLEKRHSLQPEDGLKAMKTTPFACTVTRQDIERSWTDINENDPDWWLKAFQNVK